MVGATPCGTLERRDRRYFESCRARPPPVVPTNLFPSTITLKLKEQSPARPPSAYETLVRRLREARKKAGITQAALAGRLGQHQSFVSKYETHERLLDPVEYLEIAHAIGMDPFPALEECEKYLVKLVGRGRRRQ